MSRSQRKNIKAIRSILITIIFRELSPKRSEIMKNKIFKVYLDLNSFDDKEFKKLWDYVFDNADSFSLRFPNHNHATSNTMKLKYNNKGELDEEFIDYLNKNQALICDCDRYLIKKYISNIYLDEKYGSLAQIYYCKIFDCLVNIIFNDTLL